MGYKSFFPLVACLGLVTSAATAQERHYRALVIGNADYGDRQLPRALTNARSVAGRLLDLNYDVTLSTNADRTKLAADFARFRQKIAAGDVVLLYYAGRVTRSGGAASLVPVRDASRAGFPLNIVLDTLQQSRSALNLLVFDILDDSPFGSNWLGTIPRATATTLILSANERPLTAKLLQALANADRSMREIVNELRPVTGPLAWTDGNRTNWGLPLAPEMAEAASQAPLSVNANPPPVPVASADPGPVSVPSSAPATAASEAFTRFPTMNAPPSVTVGVPFSVLVSLTTDKQTPEVKVRQVGPNVKATPEGGLQISLPCHPACEMEVVLAAPGFDFASGSNTAAIEVAPDGDSTPARFNLKGLSAGLARLEATFWYRGAFLARAVRTIQITEMATDRIAPRAQSITEAAAPAPAGPPAALPMLMPAPDLTVRWEESTFGTQHYCLVIVTSPHLGAIKSAPCVPGTDLARYLGERYQQLHEMTGRGVAIAGQNRARMASDYLRGLGRELYDHFATKPFQDAFWALVDKERSDPGFHFRTIQIYTNNPVLPWEILVPARPDGSQAGEFLGVRYEVARWHIGNRIGDLPPLSLPLRSIVAFAPHYQGSTFLPHQREELDALRELPGFREGAGNTAALLDLLDHPPQGIIHFAGHGFARAGATGVYQYGLLFEDTTLSPIVWRGHSPPGQGNRPLVVLNACDSGEEQKVGSFIDGWASVLLETGASGFIGGLWPLGDKGAAEFSREFYDDLNSALKEGKTVSVADLLRRVRGQFSKTDDPTFLAYVFYGDARLRIVP